MGLPGRELGMGHPGELQCCSALWMLQREENKDKFRKELMREAHLMAFNFSRVRLPRMWVFVHLTWLVWVFMKCLLEPQKPNSRLTEVCCLGHVTALRIATAVCTTPHPCGFFPGLSKGKKQIKVDAGKHNSPCLCTHQPIPEIPPVPGVGPAPSICPS